MILKEFLELRRDKRTMAMIIVLPLVLLVIFGYAANFQVNDVPTRVYGPTAQAVAAQLKAPFDVKEVDPSGTREEATDALRAQDAGAVVLTDETGKSSTVLIDGSSQFSAQAASSAALATGGALKPDILFNPDLKTSWVMVPALIGMIMAFIGTIVTAIGLVRERQAGTLEQLAVMPFKASDVIVGKRRKRSTAAEKTRIDMPARTPRGRARELGGASRSMTPLEIMLKYVSGKM
ncbi:ABC transporter permease [Streptomyces sp. NPDC058865]|uniref:ABC transporter permease n=1 Tax=Streptomyces sp. NPDC058865 TaxID=3346655 RepID=UPI0036B9D440